MTTRLVVYASYQASQISEARKDFYARAIRAAGILADVYDGHPIPGMYRAVEWGRFDDMLRACVRHAAKAQGMKARDLWAVLPEDVCDRVEDAAGVFTYC